MASDLEIRIGADLSEIKGALASLQKEISSVGKTSQTQNPFQSVESGAKTAIAAVGRLVASIATVATVIKTIQIADQFTTLNARLKLATGSTDEFVRAQQALFEMAQRTRTGLAETIDIYSKISLAVKDAGVGQETLLQVVETINQAVQLSGSSAEATQAALVQLGQGLASGTLRGEELNSVLEQTPALADAIAKGMGITRGELRKYGEDGKITAQQVIQALQAQREEVQKNFDQLPLTVGQALTQLKNSTFQLIGVFDNVSQSTAGLAEVISRFAKFLSSDEVQNSVVQIASIWTRSFQILIDDAAKAVDVVRSATKNMFGSGQDLLSFLGQAFTQFPINVRTAVIGVTVYITSFVDRVVAYAKFAKEAIAAIFNDDSIDSAYKRFQIRLNAIDKAATASIRSALAERQKVLDEAANAAQKAQDQRDKARQNTGKNSLGSFRQIQTDKQKSEAEQIRKAELDAEERLLKDSAKRQIGILDQLYADAKLSMREYYTARAEIEVAELDRAIAVEKERAKLGKAERIKALAEIEILEKQKTDVINKAERERFEAQKVLDNELTQARIQQLQNEGKTADAERLRLETQYSELLKRLEAESNQSGIALVKNLINVAAARAEFQALQTEFEKVTTQLQQKQQTTTANVTSGLITPAQGAQQSATDRQIAIEQLTVLNAKLQELATRTNDPTIIQGAQNLALTLKNLAIESATGWQAATNSLRASLAEMNRTFEQAAVNAGVSALEGFFNNLIDGSMSAADALRGFVRSFAISMAQIAARALATFVVLSLLDAVFPGAGRMVAAAGGATAGGTPFTNPARVLHSGGIVGSGGVITRANPLLFAGAPRYHSGGMVGLKPGEVPAILQTGEEVLSRRDPRNAANGGGGTNVRIINSIDPELAAEYFNSPTGEQTFVNLISRNAATLRNVLA